MANAIRIHEVGGAEVMRLEDVEDFDAAEGSEHGWLIRTTIVLGCVLRCLREVSADLCELGIEPDLDAIEQPVVDLTPAPAVSSFTLYEGFRPNDYEMPISP